MVNKTLGVEVSQEHRGRVGYGSLADVTNALESAVSGGDYLLGDRFSAADVYVGSEIGWGVMTGTLEKRPAFERYWQRISARPAAQRAKEIDDSLLPAESKPQPASSG